METIERWITEKNVSIQISYSDLETAVNNCMRRVIDEIKTLPVVPKLPDRCTFKEAIQITGLSESALYKMSSKSEIPCEKYGKRLIFSRKALDQWMRDRTTSPLSITDQIAESARKRTR